MAARGDVIGKEVLVVPASGAGVGLSNIPSNATMLRIFINPEGTTGANMVGVDYWDQGLTGGIVFTDSGGYLEVMGRTSVERFGAVSLDGAQHSIIVYYHIFPFR